MTTMPNEAWFTCLPPCEADVPCGSGRHLIRWEAGALELDSHADPEAELVLAALGGEKARCVEVAEAWARHAADLTVLGIGPRELAGLAVSWEDVDAAGPGPAGGGGFVFTGPGQGAVRRPSAMLAAALARATAQRSQLLREQEEAKQRRTGLLSLFALGPAFQVRLTGHVAAAQAGQLGEPDERGRHRRPVLTAALEGRLAPVAERWLGLDPDYVKASLHTGPGWGSAELTGRGEQRRLRVGLPADWLARVWACGLALVGGHLVVAVDQAGWPDARVLALRGPGTEPVVLDVHAPRGGQQSGGAVGGNGAGNAPHWEI
jgi:hypothetical protein